MKSHVHKMKSIYSGIGVGTSKNETKNARLSEYHARKFLAKCKVGGNSIDDQMVPLGNFESVPLLAFYLDDFSRCKIDCSFSLKCSSD